MNRMNLFFLSLGLGIYWKCRPAHSCLSLAQCNPPVMARFIRFHPLAWYGHLSMRSEVYGCRGILKKSCSFIICLNGRLREVWLCLRLCLVTFLRVPTYGWLSRRRACSWGPSAAESFHCTWQFLASVSALTVSLSPKNLDKYNTEKRK